MNFEIDLPWLTVNGKDGSLFFIDRMAVQQKDALEKATNPFSGREKKPQ